MEHASEIVITTSSRMLREPSMITGSPLYEWEVHVAVLDATGQLQEGLLSHVEFQLHATFPEPRRSKHLATG